MSDPRQCVVVGVENANPSSALDAERELELVSRVTEALARFAVAGELRVERGELVLHSAAELTRRPVVRVLAEWDRLSLEHRQLRAQELARELVAARRQASVVSKAPSPARLELPWALVVLLVLVVGVGVFAAVAGGGQLSARAAASASSSAALPVSETLCLAAARRAVRGATLTSLDADGWVVQVELLTNTPGDVPVRLGRVLAPRPDGTYRVLHGAFSDLEAAGTAASLTVVDAGANRLVRVTLSGRYALPYFDETRRGAYYQLASELYEALGARAGAVSASCLGSSERHVGAWFRGQDTRWASSALVATFFSGDIAAAEKRLPTPFDRSRLSSLIDRHSAMLSGPPDGELFITFPFAQANRAELAALGVARFTGLTDR